VSASALASAAIMFVVGWAAGWITLGWWLTRGTTKDRMPPTKRTGPTYWGRDLKDRPLRGRKP
jgi:hypothetical protein